MQRMILLTLSLTIALIYCGCSRNYNYIPDDNRKIAEKYYFNQGMHSLSRHNAVDAVPFFSEVIRINSDSAEAYYQRARIYDAAEFTELSKNDFETAKKLSEKYRLMDALEPLGFELSNSDIEILRPVAVPEDAAIVADKPNPLE